MVTRQTCIPYINYRNTTEKVFTTFYEDEKDIGDLNVLGAIAKELELNEKEFLEEITSKSQLARLDELNALSEEYDITRILNIFSYLQLITLCCLLKRTAGHSQGSTPC